MTDFYRWQTLTCMRLLIWESSVSPISLGARRAIVAALTVALPFALASAALSLAAGVLIFSTTYPAFRKQSFEQELKARLLLYVPNNADGYYRLLASIAIGQCNREMLSKWIQSESRTLQREAV